MKRNVFLFIPSGLALAAAAGCASPQFITPKDHPANSQATGSTYTPPRDPFQTQPQSTNAPKAMDHPMNEGQAPMHMPGPMQQEHSDEGGDQ